MSFWGSLDVININILQSSKYKNNSQFTPWQNEVLILHKKWLQILKGHFQKKTLRVYLQMMTMRYTLQIMLNCT